MRPVRVIAPVQHPVMIDEAKHYCRIDGDDSDALIQGLIDAAVSHFDGFRGILGRCIAEQTWRVEYDAAGQHRLPLPDVMTATATSPDGVAVAATVSHDALGSLVEIAAPATVQFTARLPEDGLEAVRNAILLWVRMRYDGLSGSEAAAYQAAIDAQLAPLRWVRI